MRKLYLLLCMMLAVAAQASHYMAGEIRYRHISGKTYEVTLITYTDWSSSQAQSADRPQLTFSWGDGTTKLVNRSSVTQLSGNTRRNVYTSQHTYTAAGRFTVSVSDANRVGNIVNITNSFNSKFYLESEVEVAGTLTNVSPVFQADLVQTAYVNRKFTFDPAITGSTSDSLWFELTPPLIGHNQFAGGFQVPPSSAQCTINPVTGVLTWENPAGVGIYTFGLRIHVFSNGVETGIVQREMLVTVYYGTGITTPVAAALTAYPNPACAGSEVLLTGLPADESGNIRVVDRSGRVLLEKQVRVVGNAVKLMVPETLAAGLYQVQLEIGNRQYHSKLLVTSPR